MPVDWFQYESEVLRLYVEEGKTAEETVKCLNQQHGSGITIRQFKAKFGGLKKLRATEWQEVGREISKRQDQGKTSEVYVCGQLQGPARVRRALQHSKTKRGLSETEIDWGLELHKLRRVEIRTPEPRVHNQLEIKTLAAPSAESSHPSGAEYQENNQSLTPGDGNFLNELGIDIDDMELDFSTPKLDHYFNTEKFSSANSPQPAAITKPRMAPSFFAAHNEAYDLSLNEERALRTGTAFSPFAAHSTSQVSPREASMTHQSTELLAFPESLRFNTSNFETVLPSSIDWDQLRRRVLMGQAGWLESQLRSVDSNPMIQTSTLGLLEKVLETTSNGKEIRFDGFNQESLHEMFFVVTRLVSNRFLDWKPLINFMRWIIQNGSVGELFKFLEARLYNKSDLIREVLNAIWTEAAHFDHPRWSSSYRHESPFYLEYQRETIRLIREADNQILSGALGGKLLVHAARSMSLDTVKLLVESGAPIDYSTSSKPPLDIVGRLSPLCESVRRGSVNVLKYLIDKGANVNARFPKAGRSDVQLSALTEAVSAKNLEMVKVLLEAGSEVFDDQIVGREAIYQFAKRTSMAVYQLLQESLELGLASGAASNSTLLVEAAEMGNTSLSRFLMKHGIVRQEILEAGLCHAAEMGDVGAVRTLLHRGIDPNALRYRQTLLYKERTGDPIHGLYENANGDTDQESDKDLDNKVEYDHPLWLAFDRKTDDFNSQTTTSTDIIYLIVKAGATLSEASVLRLCHRQLCKDNQIELNVLVQAGFHASLVGPSALVQQAAKGSIAKVGALLDGGIHINSYGTGGRSALQTAACNFCSIDMDDRNPVMVQYLLERGADVNLPAGENHGLTALQAAALAGNHRIVDCLLEAGADVRAPPAKERGFTVLEAAASALMRARSHRGEVEKRVATFRKLLASGAPVNRSDGSDNSLLHYLVRASQMQCLNEALGAGVNTEDYVSTVVHHPPAKLTPLQVAGATYDVKAIRALLDHGANINAPASNNCRTDCPGGRTALQAAVDDIPYYDGNDEAKETEETVQLLLQNNANVNAPPSSNFGRTALQAATSTERPDAKLVALLLQHGADVNADPSERGGVTALQGAAISGDIQIARILLAHGANVNAPRAPEDGRTAIEGAAEHGRLDMVRLLLDNGALPDVNDGFSRAIELAERESCFQIADILRERQLVSESSLMGLLDQPGWSSEVHSSDLDMMLFAEDEHAMRF